MNSLSLFIGLRYTLSRKQSHLVAFISRISTIGMVLAVSVLITVVSVMNGFDRELRERILAIVPHAMLTQTNQTTEWRELVDLAKSHPGVVDATPISYVQSLVMHKSSVRAAFLYGIDPLYEPEDSIMKRLLGGEVFSQLNHKKTAVIGIKLATKLQIEKGDNLKIIVPAKNRTELPVIDHFIVQGFLDSGTEIDEKIILTHRANVALLNKKPVDSVDGIRLYVDDLFAARSIAQELRELTGLYDVQDWSARHGNLYYAVQMSRKLVSLLVFFIIAVAAFNVVSTLVLAVNDKASDIAVLKTMGCSNQQILGIFIVQGSVIGLVGVTVGIVLGIVFSLIVSDGVVWLEQLIGYQFLNTDVYPIDHLPSDIRSMDIVMVASIALLLSILATIIPAWQASKVDPAEVLRYE